MRMRSGGGGACAAANVLRVRVLRVLRVDG